MSRTQRYLFAVALVAPLFFLAPPEAEAQVVRGRTYYGPYAQRYVPGTRYYAPRNYYAPRSQYYRSPGSRYYGPRYSGRSRGGYYSPYGRNYYGTPRNYNRGGSVRVGPLWFGW